MYAVAHPNVTGQHWMMTERITICVATSRKENKVGKTKQNKTNQINEWAANTHLREVNINNCAKKILWWHFKIEIIFKTIIIHIGVDLVCYSTAAADVEFDEIFCLIGRIASDVLATTTSVRSWERKKRIGHTVVKVATTMKTAVAAVVATVAVGCWRRRKNVAMLRYSRDHR